MPMSVPTTRRTCCAAVISVLSTVAIVVTGIGEVLVTRRADDEELLA